MFVTPNLKTTSFKTPSLSNSSRSNISNCNFTPLIDRYIPNRSLNNLESSHHLLTSLPNNMVTGSKNSENYLTKRKLFLEVCPETAQFQSRVLSLSCKTISRKEKEEMQMKELSLKYNTSLNMRTTPRNIKRVLPKFADTVLDAPNVIDDFYLNLLDWSEYNGKVAVAMSSNVYIWNENTKTAENIVWDDGSDDHYITSLKWLPKRNALSVAKSNNMLYVWDVCKMKCISKIKDHAARVASLSWNESIISSGDQIGVIMNHDIRSFNSNKLSEFKFHTGDVCKLTWSQNGRFLACGSDDKLVSIWDKSALSSFDSKPMFVMQEHTAAVKAIDWCPWNSGFLATGGGRTDGTIKMWNIFSGGVSKSLETDSQITGLLWASNTKELISSHGCPDNRLSVWKFPNLEKVGDLIAHSERILSIALSQNGESVASLSADETLRFWECFKSNRVKSVFSTPVIGIANLQNIR